MKIVLLILLFVYVIAFFWILWKSASVWRWYHITLMSLAFLLVIPLLPMTAAVLKSRSEWSRVHVDLSERLERGEQEQQRLKHGDPGDPAGGVGLLALQEQLRSFNREVGRVNRDMVVRNRGPQGIVLAPAPQQQALPEGVPVEEEAEAAPPAGANLPLITPGMVVYAFVEQPWQQSGFTVPTFYLGEFRVEQSTPDSVTVVPNAPLEPGQQQAVNQAGRWALYELVPLDGHDVFVAEGSQSDEDAIFGRVNEELVNSLLGNRVLPKTLQSYLRDGTRAQPDDPPATRWVKVEFTKNYEITVDGQDQRSASDGGAFDSLGQAVDSRLQRTEGDAVSFSAGDQLIVKQEAATTLINEGAAKLVDTYFVRPLNSYRLVLPALRQQIDYLTRQAENLQRQQEVVQEAVTLTTAMQTEGQQRQLNLEKDAAQIGREVAALKAYQQQLEEKLRATKRKMAELYRDNLARERELTAIQQQLTRQIDARVGAAGS
ncbi:coiled-coil domain-containing protein [Candidatus Laterigemmans baculatus]|uniref:hypothetical protein n=1 Tax=Candidatus Laterigemmans baculatus TaxID=2770505 RepID=UPI0013DAB348|nr:hypothetical protein [Candidatus Laterigemmans baculatus]